MSQQVFLVDYANTKDFMKFEGPLPSDYVVYLFVRKGDDMPGNTRKNKVMVKETLTDDDQAVEVALLPFILLDVPSLHENCTIHVISGSKFSNEFQAQIKVRTESVVFCQEAKWNICKFVENSCAECGTIFVNSNALKKHHKRSYGCFQSFLNAERSDHEYDECRTTFMRLATEILHAHKMKALKAGSVLKKTDVNGYSDIDVWVESSLDVTVELRNEISEEIKQRMIKNNWTVKNMQYKPVATCYTCVFNEREMNIDLVFEKAEWVDKAICTPPDKNAFLNWPDGRYCVQALKLLSKYHPVS